jgi:N,N'-diacetyllegionaminate synthase
MDRMVSVVNIGGREVGPGRSCFIIAEAGVNHNGDLALALRLVDAAVEAGADAVKFQTFVADKIATAEAPKAEYQLQTTRSDETQVEMLRGLELSAEAHHDLSAHCRRRGIIFLSSPFDEGSADFLDELGVPAFKIGSGEITNWSFLTHVARKGKPIILSTGMSYLSEVDEAVRTISGTGCERLILLHCVSNYPAELRDANLRAMRTLSDAFRVPVGYSDHTLCTEATLAAVALGACVIERHLTLDRGFNGPDHRASTDPPTFAALVASIRRVEASLGSGDKVPTASELPVRCVARRSLVATTDIAASTVLVDAMVAARRPGMGVSPRDRGWVVGRRVRRLVRKGELLLPDVLE